MPLLVSIHIAPAAGAPMLRVPTCRAISGAGLEGDRYTNRAGTWSSWPKDHEVTLIEEEVCLVSELAELGVGPMETRRNLVTRGVRLNPLVGQTFQIGTVILRGTRLCEPCDYLEKLLNTRGLAKLLAGRGGLRGVIVEGGMLHKGDSILLPPSCIAPLEVSLISH